MPSLHDYRPFVALHCSQVFLLTCPGGLTSTMIRTPTSPTTSSTGDTGSANSTQTGLNVPTSMARDSTSTSPSLLWHIIIIFVVHLLIQYFYFFYKYILYTNIECIKPSRVISPSPLEVNLSIDLIFINRY